MYETTSSKGDIMLLEKLSFENVEKCLNMKLNENQKAYVTSNELSLAHAYLALEEGNMIPFPFLVKENDDYVGFLMLSYCKSDSQQPEQNNAYCIWRIMIDKQFQGKGYGRSAVNEAIELAQKGFAGQADMIVLFVEPENHVAIKLYESCGFSKTNEVIDGQTKYERRLK